MSKNLRIVIAAEAIDCMTAAGESALPRETGGVLVGYRAGDAVCVEYVLVVPGPSSGTRFVLRQRPRDHALREFLRPFPEGSPLGYVGTWHSHPSAAGPSSIDRATFARECLAAPDTVAMIIMSRTKTRWVPHGVTGHRFVSRQTSIDVLSR